MINWQSVIFNSFWIVGLSVLLAAASYHVFDAGQNGHTLRAQFGSPSFLRFFWLAAMLIAVGLAGTSTQVFETLMWAGMALIALVAMIRSAVQPAV